MLNIVNERSHGTARLKGKISVDKDPDDPMAFIVEATLRFTLESREDAEAWEGTDADPMLIGLAQKYDHATSETNNRKWRDSFVDDRELLVNLSPARAGEDAGRGYDGGMRVKAIRASLSKAECVVDVALVAGGLSSEDQENVARLLRGVVHVQTENRQVEMFGGPADRQSAAAGER